MVLDDLHVFLWLCFVLERSDSSTVLCGRTAVPVPIVLVAQEF